MIRAAALFLILLAGPSLALDLSLPANARQTVERNTGPDTYAAPVGVFEDGKVATLKVEGQVNRAAWRIDSPGLTPFQVIRPLREQLVQAGFEIALDCAADICGGFDFRFATETLPGPNMYVNIRAFHVVTGLSPAGDEAVTLLASTSATSAYVQIIHAGGGADDLRIGAGAPSGPPASPSDRDPGDLTAQLLERGHAVLRDLDFDTGSTNLGSGPFASLTQLASFLAAQPQLRIALVGHTDTVGGLAPNIQISRARARSVRQRLIEVHGVDPSRMDAEGMGYLSPVASNLTPEGRDSNRRVEVVLLPDG